MDSLNFQKAFSFFDNFHYKSIEDHNLIKQQKPHPNDNPAKSSHEISHKDYINKKKKKKHKLLLLYNHFTDRSASAGKHKPTSNSLKPAFLKSRHYQINPR